MVEASIVHTLGELVPYNISKVDSGYIITTTEQINSKL